MILVSLQLLVLIPAIKMRTSSGPKRFWWQYEEQSHAKYTYRTLHVTLPTLLADVRPPEMALCHNAAESLCAYKRLLRLGLLQAMADNCTCLDTVPSDLKLSYLMICCRLLRLLARWPNAMTACFLAGGDFGASTTSTNGPREFFRRVLLSSGEACC